MVLTMDRFVQKDIIHLTVEKIFLFNIGSIVSFFSIYSCIYISFVIGSKC